MKEKKVNNICLFKTDTMKVERFVGSLSTVMYEQPSLHFLLTFAAYLYQISVSKFCLMIILITYTIVFI